MTDLIELHVPDIGDFKDIPIVEIPVSVGDRIEEDDTVIILESDKATLDVPATTAGEIVELLVSDGDLVSEGSVIARLRVSAGANAPKAAPETAKPVSVLQTPSAEATPTPKPAINAPAPATASQAAIQPSVSVGTPVYASPSIRHYARTLGVNASHVTGSGDKGRILREDIEAFVKKALSGDTPRSATQASTLPHLPDWPKVDYEKFGSVERVALSRIARISGPALSRNSVIIPHVCNFDETDITELEDFRNVLNAEAREEDVKLSILAFTVKAVVSALKAYPKFNASLDGEEIVLKNYWNIGVAADTPDGLVVPVIKEADQKGIRTIAAEMKDLATKARKGKISPADMSGATFTISSLGGIGGTGFTPIINAPEVAIMGMTRSSIRPVWTGTAFDPRLVQPLSLSWDHRVVDGVAAARFLQHVCRTMADFRRIAV